MNILNKPIVSKLLASAGKSVASALVERLVTRLVNSPASAAISPTSYPSLYKTAKFLGTYNHNVTKHNGQSYTTCDGKTYMIKLLPAALQALPAEHEVSTV